VRTKQGENEFAVREVRRIEDAYAERERTLPTVKRDKSNRGNQWLMRARRTRLEEILRERVDRPLADCRILDVGCGFGGLLGWFHELGVPADNLFGIDLLQDRIETARATYPDFTFRQANAEELDFPDESFDLVTVFTVFSSILDRQMATNVAASICRVLKRDGAVVWYDMRYPNPWNRHLTVMTKRRIRDLFASFSIELESITLLPPLARSLGRSADRMYPLLAAIPVLRSHYLGLLRPGVVPRHRE
jgi:ubiquinone/menaquinone biosynthesis C-methylase UbiE